MSRAFVKPIDPATATAENLWTLMLANGCVSTPMGMWLQLTAPTAEPLYWGSNSSVDATSNSIAAGDAQFLPGHGGVVDPSLFWVFCAGGTIFQCAYQAR